MSTPTILSTDIGYDPDDFFALLLALASPELDLKLIVTADEVERDKRAAFVRHILGLLGRNDIPVVAGRDIGSVQFSADDIIEDGRSDPPIDAVGALKKIIDASPETIYIGIGGCTDLADYLRTYPEDRAKLRIYMMGGAIDFSRHDGWIEHNIRIDVPSARFVLESEADVSLVMAQTTYDPLYEVSDMHGLFKRLEASGRPEHALLVHHCRTWNRWKGFWSYMHDPLTVAAALGGDFVTFERTRIRMDERGNIAASDQGFEIDCSDSASKAAEFMDFLEARLFSYGNN